MGHLRAIELASGEFGLTIEQAISLHLTSNHYPPAPTTLVQPYLDAIAACNRGDWDAEIDLNGTTYRGSDTAPAHLVVDGFHLDAWLTPED